MKCAPPSSDRSMIVFATQIWSAFFGLAVIPPKYQPRFQMRLSPVTLRQVSAAIVRAVKAALPVGSRCPRARTPGAAWLGWWRARSGAGALGNPWPVSRCQVLPPSIDL